MSEVLVTRDLRKSFGGIAAVNGVDLTVREGELTAIIGPNGAGKTTLFNLITGFERPDSGKVYFMGRDVTGEKPYNLARMGLIRTFQIVRPLRNLTVLQNVLIGCRVRGLGPEAAEESLRAVGLWEKRDVLASLLTHGELKKLELARALAMRPKLLLLDEPLGGLTFSEAEEVTGAIREANANGTTVVLVEHRLRETFRIVRRVVVMNQGRIIYDGLPENVAKTEEVVKAYMGGRGWVLGT
ncbi:MAG: ABC transporter ATP-binding protein [Nitrososphaerota archaeon]|nr:ABC transporter ATP-binding protein [Candidatus Calditenuis fumarioli]